VVAVERNMLELQLLEVQVVVELLEQRALVEVQLLVRVLLVVQVAQETKAVVAVEQLL
jgi:hypothetical protein